MHWKALACSGLLAPAVVNAGWFDQVLDQAKQAVDETVSNAVEQTTSDSRDGDDAAVSKQAVPHPAPATGHAPAHDPKLVRAIQQRLNELGHNAGTPDGLYGPGTRRAIEAFQSEHGLVVTGEPTAALLAQLRDARPAAPTGSSAVATTGVAAAPKAPHATTVRDAAVAGKAPMNGRWQGQVRPQGNKGLMSHGSFDIVLGDEVKVLRYGGFGTRCLARLEGSDGSYQATFVTGQSACGTHGPLTLDADGKVTFLWEDAPNTPADQKTYTGTLQLIQPAWPRAWSTDADKRNAFDVVGFELGMSYEDALAYMKANHPDLAHEWRAIVDEGSTTIVEQLTQKDAKKLGPHMTHGEQLSLLFEAQTPEQMQVEQDPDVLARRAEIDDMARKRGEERARLSRDRGDKLRGLSRVELAEYRRAQRAAGPADAPPPLPEKPPLRPSGADAELLVIGRLMTFSSNQRPHEANVTRALIDKYGAPSARVEQGPRRFLQWTLDPDGNRIADAKGGPCDHISKAPGRIEGLVDYYGTKGLQIDVPPTVSPKCGLTVKARMDYNDRDRGVNRMSVIAYDQQRLLGDEWYKIVQFSQALAAKAAARQQATKQVQAPDL